MIDIERQVAYWRDGAREDAAVATESLQGGHTRHALFWDHLALEKALKAHVCQATRDLPPKIHSLTRLAQLSELELDQALLDTLAVMNRFAIEGRYSDMLAAETTGAVAEGYHARAQGAVEWLLNQL